MSATLSTKVQLIPRIAAKVPDRKRSAAYKKSRIAHIQGEGVGNKRTAFYHPRWQQKSRANTGSELTGLQSAQQFYQLSEDTQNHGQRPNARTARFYEARPEVPVSQYPVSQYAENTTRPVEIVDIEEVSAAINAFKHNAVTAEGPIIEPTYYEEVARASQPPFHHQQNMAPQQENHQTQFAQAADITSQGRKQSNGQNLFSHPQPFAENAHAHKAPGNEELRQSLDLLSEFVPPAPEDNDWPVRHEEFDQDSYDINLLASEQPFIPTEPQATPFDSQADRTLRQSHPQAQTHFSDASQFDLSNSRSKPSFKVTAALKSSQSPQNSKFQPMRYARPSEPIEETPQQRHFPQPEFREPSPQIDKPALRNNIRPDIAMQSRPGQNSVTLSQSSGPVSVSAAPNLDQHSNKVSAPPHIAHNKFNAALQANKSVAPFAQDIPLRAALEPRSRYPIESERDYHRRLEAYFGRRPLWVYVAIVTGLSMIFHPWRFHSVYGLELAFDGPLIAGATLLMLGLIWRIFGVSTPSSAEVDDCTADALNKLESNAFEQMRVDEATLISAPIVFTGFPDLSKATRPFKSSKYGKDHILRYTPRAMTILAFQEEDIVTYEGAVDLTTGACIYEKISEFAYSDITSVGVARQRIPRDISYYSHYLSLLMPWRAAFIDRINRLVSDQFNGSAAQRNSRDVFYISLSNGETILSVMRDGRFSGDRDQDELPQAVEHDILPSIRDLVRAKKKAA